MERTKRKSKELNGCVACKPSTKSNLSNELNSVESRVNDDYDEYPKRTKRQRLCETTGKFINENENEGLESSSDEHTLIQSESNEVQDQDDGASDSSVLIIDKPINCPETSSQ
ncbi:MAG: hypothetical protein MHMPM18_003069, partial [Marteilia pararefringens]